MRVVFRKFHIRILYYLKIEFYSRKGFVGRVNFILVHCWNIVFAFVVRVHR